MDPPPAPDAPDAAVLLRRVFACGVEFGRSRPSWRDMLPRYVDEAFEHYRARRFTLEEPPPVEKRRP